MDWIQKVLTVVLYLWYSIDLSIRSLLPWQELQKGPRPAEVTLLLDYISPILTTSLWRALKNRHWAVVLTISGRLLISLAIAFSTALLILAPTSVTIDNALFSIPKRTEAFTLDDVGPFAADMYYGVNFGKLAAPLGTFTDSYVPLIQSPAGDKVGRIPSNAVLQATIPGLQFDAGCEVVEIHDFTNAIDFRPRAKSQVDTESSILIANITTPSCQILEVPIGYTQGTEGGGAFFQAIVNDYLCNTQRSYYEAQFGIHALPNLSSAEWSNASSEHRILLTVANMSTSITGEGYKAVLFNLTALLCNPTYALNDYQSQYDQGSQTARIQLLGTSEGGIQDLLGFTSQSLLGSSVLRTVNQANTIGERISQDPFFSFMQLQPDSQSSYTPLTRFLDPKIARDRFKKVFEGVAAQLAHQLLSNNTNESKELRGTATFTQNRLHVTVTSMSIMTTIFGIMAIISITLIPLAPRNVVILEPGSVLATASSLELTADTWNVIQGLGHFRDKNIHRELLARTFAITETNGERAKLEIETSTRAQATLSTSTADSKTELRWWGPLGSQNWFLIVSFAILLVLIGLLEYFQKQSDDNDGLVKAPSRWDQLAANYVPAIISILVGAMFSSMVAASAVFAPYSDLTKGPTPFSRSVALNYMNQVGPRLEYSALKSKHFGLSIITLAQLIASFLTIVLSGLYSMEEVKFRQDILIEPLDFFNITGTIINNSSPRAGLLTKMITYYGMKFPDWTYDSIVLPRITVANTSALDDTHNVTIKSTLPGLRGRLNCTALPFKGSNLAIETDQSYDQVVSAPGQSPTLEGASGDAPNGMNLVISIDRNLSASSLCYDAGAYGNSNFMWEERLFIASGSTPTPFGKVTQLRWPSLSSNSNEDGSLDVQKRGPAPGTTDSADGCPTIGILMGQVTVDGLHKGTSNAITNNTTSKHYKMDETEYDWRITDADIGTLLCWPKADEIMVDVTFSWPSFDILDQPPPRIDESNTREVETPTADSLTWKWDDEMSGVNKYDPWVSLKNTNDIQTEFGLLQNHTNFDPFILALITGKDQVPLGQILGENNAGVLEHHFQALWQRYMAQSISQYLRVDHDFSATSSSHTQSRAPVLGYPAEAEGIQTTRRLKQNASSKVALQVMMGIMSLSVILMRLLSKFRKVLPHNPCSIAGTLSLVVDGNLKDLPLVTPERHRSGKKQYKRYLKLHLSRNTSEDSESEQKFIMGWWNNNGTWKFGIRYAENTEDS